MLIFEIFLGLKDKMKKAPTLSYLIPAYNAEAFIENCLNSILEINLSKEIIIVNDGSTDKTGEIIDRYAGQYEFIHAYHQTNAGESAARNTALSHATGKWVQHVDADDIVINDTDDFNAIFELAEQKQADVIKGLYLFSKEGQQNAITQPVFDAVKEHKAVTTSGRNFLDKCIGEFHFQQNGCFFMRRATLEKLGLKFDTTQYIGPDILFSLELFCSNITVIEVPYVFYYYQTRLGSVSNPSKTVLDLKIIRSRAKLLEKSLALAAKYSIQDSPYIHYTLLVYRLILTQDYNMLLKAGYPTEKADAEQFSQYIFSPEEYKIAKQHHQQIYDRQDGRAYYQKIAPKNQRN